MEEFDFKKFYTLDLFNDALFYIGQNLKVIKSLFICSLEAAYNEYDADSDFNLDNLRDLHKYLGDYFYYLDMLKLAKDTYRKSKDRYLSYKEKNLLSKEQIEYYDCKFSD